MSLLDDIKKREESLPKMDYKMFKGIRVMESLLLNDFDYIVLVGTGIWKELQKETEL